MVNLAGPDPKSRAYNSLNRKEKNMNGNQIVMVIGLMAVAVAGLVGWLFRREINSLKKGLSKW